MAEKTPTPRAIRREPLSFLWRILAAPQTLLLVMGLVALALALGRLIPQIPLQAADDPQAWLAVQSGILHQQRGLFQAFGLFDIHNAFWFRLVLVLAGLTLLVWLVESADLAWRAARQRRWSAAAFAFWGERAPEFRMSSSGSVQDTLARLRDSSMQCGCWYARVAAISPPNLVAGRRALALWAEPVVFGALLVALACLGIETLWGWQNPDWRPALGDLQMIGRGTLHAVRLDAFALQQDNNGRLRGYQSEITWLTDGVSVTQDVVEVQQPATFDGLAVRLVGYAPVVRMRGQDDRGHSLTFQVGGEDPSASGQVEIAFPTLGAEQLVLIYGRDLFLDLAFEPLSREGKPTLRIGLVDGEGGGRKPLATLHESGSVYLDGLQVIVDLEYRPILRVDHHPGMVGVVLASALAVVALAVGWLLAPRLLWIASGTDKNGSTVLRIFALPGARGDKWPESLLTQLREVLVDDA